MNNLYFIGYRGTGKTTVARIVAERLGRECIDADHYLQEQAEKSIAQLFDEGGEELFRDWEMRVVFDIAQRHDIVISLGGGAVLRDENRSAIRKSGRSVWLTASEEIVHQRLSTDTRTASQRPSLTDLDALEEVRQVLRQREPIYRECADLIIDTDSKTAHEVADEVLAWWASSANCASD